jgi:hypothetical protein
MNAKSKGQETKYEENMNRKTTAQIKMSIKKE